MNDLEVLKLMNRETFADRNGKILRSLLLLRENERFLNNVYSLFKNECSAIDLQKSISFLHDTEYLIVNCKNVDGCIQDIQANTFGKVKVKISSKGTRLLEGFINDDCVVV